ncbi:MAG: cell division protein FtsL [Syntrophomonadaceae bacterium]|jgi:cell division protein FtsL|nr:cell division protein FtsL [Syntrophomonadaceae bacterium]
MSRKKANKKKGKYVITLIILIIMVISIVPRAKNIWTLSVQRNELQNTKDELSLKNEKLNGEKQELNSLEVVERMARERLGMLKDGEKVVVPAEK